MRPLLLALVLAAAAGCGAEIGDECFASTDCSTTGDRVCDQSQYEGYCTILGCDHDTCPEEAVCVRFFVGEFGNRPCDPVLEDLPSSDGEDRCGLDELCTLGGQCVPRAAEARYCMKACADGGDCRDGYECRDRALMLEHGGEPVLAPGVRPDDEPQPFCAQAPIF